MIRSRWIHFLFVPALACAAPLDKPEKIPVSTWVREDLFAGWIAGDHAAMGRGAAKLKRILAQNPSSEIALAWQYMVEMYGMRRAQAARDSGAYGNAMAAAAKVRAAIWNGRSPNAGAYIIVGSTLVSGAFWAREQDNALAPWADTNS